MRSEARARERAWREREAEARGRREQREERQRVDEPSLACSMFLTARSRRRKVEAMVERRERERVLCGVLALERNKSWNG